MKIIINKPAAGDHRQERPITLDGVSFGYDGCDVFSEVNACVPRRAVTAVTGVNGSGKSTMLGLIAGLLQPRHGTIDRGDHRNIAYAVQRSQVTDTFPMTVADAVMMGRWRRLGLLRRPGRRDRDITEYWLSAFGLLAHSGRRLGELSGGQRQRVLLAQAFAQEASVLLLDEPTTGLDEATGALVIQHLRALAAAGVTVVAATHDPAVTADADHHIDLSL